LKRLALKQLLLLPWLLRIQRRQPNPKEVTIDRPFIFLIRDIDTRAILLVGRVMNRVPGMPTRRDGRSLWAGQQAVGKFSRVTQAGGKE
jgi:hypothetical protein